LTTVYLQSDAVVEATPRFQDLHAHVTPTLSLSDLYMKYVYSADIVFTWPLATETGNGCETVNHIFKWSKMRRNTGQMLRVTICSETS